MFAVTTSLDGTNSMREAALEIGRKYSLTYISRENSSLEKTMADNLLDGILVVGKNRLTLYYPGGGELFFHPGMAKLRIKEIARGKTDQMICALGLKPGDSVLDCTMGMGIDALVCAHVAGCKGSVSGLEKSPGVYIIVSEGLKSIKNVTVDHRDYKLLLPALEDNSYDVVYFDPMFRLPKIKSHALNAIRPIADRSTVSRDDLLQAMRVCRRRVVMKEQRNSTEFARLGIKLFCGGRYSTVAYGFIEKGGVWL